jgi:LacI family transcriptional regulator
MKSASAYVTQQDVAKRASVHQTTVSLVFRNHPSVPAATRERVLAAARELGYRKHPLLAALMSTRLRLTPGTGNSVLAFLTDFDQRDRWKESPTAVEMYAGAKSRAQELGFRIETFWLGNPEIRPARLAEILTTRNIHGLLLAPTHQPRGFFAFNFAPFAVVGLGMSSETSAVLTVAHDHFGGMRTALQQCIKAGRRRIGVMLNIAANEIVRSKWLAAYALIGDSTDALTRLPVWQEAFSPTRLKLWLTKHRPDALVGTFDQRMPAFLAANGYQVPEDIALVELSIRADEKYYAGMYQRSETIGRRAVDLLVGSLNHNDSGLLPMRQILEIEGEWRHGPSMKARSEGPSPD